MCRRPGTRFVMFGDTPMDLPFPYEQLGVSAPEELAWAYSEATVGLSLSLTNYSLIPQEMLACGLPVVELASGAGHDAGVLAAAGVPTAMLFVRSLNGGISHSPDELSAAEDVELGVDVLAGALGALASSVDD